MNEASDTALVGQFLEHVKPLGALTQQRAASVLTALGGREIHQTTVSRWVNGKRDRLETHTRQAIESYLRGDSVPDIEEPEAVVPVASDDRQFFDEVKQILRDQQISPGMKVLLIDAATSAYTKAALYRGAVAEEERARAVGQAEKTQQTRTEAIREVERYAGERFAALRRATSAESVDVDEELTPEEIAAHGTATPPRSAKGRRAVEG